MTSDNERKPLRRTIRGGRPFFFSDPAIDKVLNMTITLASEVWALRERLGALEAVQVRQGSLSPTEIDDYEFTPEQEERMAADRREFIENLFRVLQEQVDAASAKATAGGVKLDGKPPVFGARISALRKTAPKPAARRAPARGRAKAGRARSDARRSSKPRSKR
jgi:hypothetical protein